MDVSCCFCGKIEEEVPLIEIASNSLLIGKSHYEFSHIFQELLGIRSEDLSSLTFICDICKDSAVQFFIFKINARQNSSPHRKMILSQIDDFLKQTKNLEEIQVVRKLYSITLQIDQSLVLKESIKPQEEIIVKEVESDYEEVLSDAAMNDEEILEDEVTKTEKHEEIILEVSFCSKCDEDLGNESLELHEFFRHSLLGIQIENEAENSRVDNESSVRKCGSCGLEFEDSTTLAHHIFIEHLKSFGFYDDSADLETINKYLTHLNKLICGVFIPDELKIDERVKEYFYQVYQVKNSEQYEEIEEETFIESAYEEPTEFTESRPSKQSKNELSLSSLDEESREWVRNEIANRKRKVVNEFGTSIDIFQCAYCSVYSSKSASGFRYHLIIKHLKDKTFKEICEFETGYVARVYKPKSGRNTCIECNLKFKDSKLLTSHQNCHSLFEKVSHYYTFPACNTCSSLYIDESSLNLHLNKHDAKKDVTEPIQVPAGAVVIQGKRAMEKNNENEVPAQKFSWSCGHCSESFTKKSSCRFHLMMVHTAIFTCPMDKRDFSGYKAVSLFCHHLKNKHPELFPDMEFPCTFCNLNFSSIYDKLSHMKNCSEKKFECDHCQKKFFKKGDLVSHLKFISGEHYFQCKMCEKRCETLSDLKIHFRSHTKEKPFSCAICNKSFRTLAARSAHVEGHNTNVTYVCQCGKSFKQRQMYRRHMKAFHEAITRTEKIVTQSKLQVLDEESL